MATFGQIIFYSLVTLIVAFATIIILIFVITFTRQTSGATSRNTAPIGNIGEDEVLDCSLYTNVLGQDKFNDVSVTWQKKDVAGEVYVYRNGAPSLKTQAAQFKGRTQLFTDNISEGNASLRLRSVRLSDQGEFTCSIQSSDGGGEVDIFLRTAAYTPPIFSFSNGSLTAVASKWFPKPNVTWVNQTGSVLEGTTSLSKSHVGLYRVVSRLQHPHLDETYSCRIENEFVIAVGEATVTESGVLERTYFIFNVASSQLASAHINAMIIVLCIYYGI